MSEPYELRPYQAEAAAAVIGAYQAGLHRVLVQMATGLGKTVLFAHLARRMVVEAGGRVLVIAHRDELIEQAREKLLAADPGLDVGVVKAGRDEQASIRAEQEARERAEQERREAERQRRITMEVDLWRRQSGRGNGAPVYWRDQPGTAKQLGWLRWQGIPFRPGITKGEAHDWISKAREQAS